jgi:hypothetical protein
VTWILFPLGEDRFVIRNQDGRCLEATDVAWEQAGKGAGSGGARYAGYTSAYMVQFDCDRSGRLIWQVKREPGTTRIALYNEEAKKYLCLSDWSPPGLPEREVALVAEGANAPERWWFPRNPDDEKILALLQV